MPTNPHARTRRRSVPRAVLALIGLAALALGTPSAAAQTIDPATATATPLDELVRRVIDQHPSVLAALAESRASAEDLAAAKLQRLPTLSVQNETAGHSPSAVVQISQTLWNAGRTSAVIDGAQATASAVDSRAVELRYAIALNTLDAWQQLSAALGRIRVLQSGLEVLGNYEALMQRRVDAKVSPRIELELIASRAAQSRADLQLNQAGVRLALSRLEQLRGAPVDARVAEGGDILKAQADRLGDSLGSDPTAAFAEGVAKHPAVQRATHEAEAATERFKVAEADRFPQVYVRLAHNLGNTTNSANSAQSVYLGLQYTPGAGFATLTQARAAQIRIDAAQQGREAARRDVTDALRTDWEQLQSNHDRERLLASSIDGGRAVLDSYERQFVAGRRSWQDVLNALRELNQSESALVDTQVGQMASAYRLRLRLGRLAWQQ